MDEYPGGGIMAEVAGALVVAAFAVLAVFVALPAIGAAYVWERYGARLGRIAATVAVAAYVGLFAYASHEPDAGPKSAFDRCMEGRAQEDWEACNWAIWSGR